MTVPAPIAYVQSASIDSSGTSVNLAFPSNNGTGNFIVCTGRSGTAGVTVGFTDSKNNAYVPLDTGGEGAGAANDTDQTAYAANIAGGANTVTFSATSGSTNRFAIHEYSGVATSFPVSGIYSVATDGGTPSTTMDSGATTPLVDNCLIYGACVVVNHLGTLSSTGSGFTQRQDPANAVCTCDNILTGGRGVAIHATFAETGAADNWRALVVAFKPASFTWARTQGFHPGRSPGAAPVASRFYQSPKAFIPATPSGDVTVALTGQAATLSPGQLTPDTAVPLVGSAATFTAGILVQDLSVALTGQSATFAAGSVIPGFSVALVGQTGTLTSGLLVPDTLVGLTGQSAAFSIGFMAPGAVMTLTGQSGTFTTGALSVSISVALTGSVAVFATGSLESSGGTPVNPPPGSGTYRVVQFIANVGSLMIRV